MRQAAVHPVRMNTTRKNTRRRQTSDCKPAQLKPADAQQFQEMPDPLTVVEHLTIPGFIRRSPHRFHMDEIIRFGDKVGRVAESMQVSYLTTIDPSLGQIRLFPVPLLNRVYQIQAGQFGWEPLEAVPPALEDQQAKILRANTRAKDSLKAAVEHVENPIVAQAMTTVLGFLESEATRLRGEESAEPAAPAPLRSL